MASYRKFTSLIVQIKLANHEVGAAKRLAFTSLIVQIKPIVSGSAPFPQLPFTSLIVQIKLCTISFRLPLSSTVYIPHSSDKTGRDMGITTLFVEFTSLIVQIKRVNWG